jgi:hypothetical protein
MYAHNCLCSKLDFVVIKYKNKNCNTVSGSDPDREIMHSMFNLSIMLDWVYIIH